MNKTSRSKLAKAAICITIVMLVFLFTLTIIPSNFNVLADPTNETVNDTTNETIDDVWFDTHWGGDTGEEYYKEPVPVVVDDEPEPTPSICGTSMIVLGVCVPAAGIQYLKKRREPKIE